MDDLQAQPSQPSFQPGLWLPLIAIPQRDEQSRLCPDRVSIWEIRVLAGAHLLFSQSLLRVRLQNDSSRSHRTCPPCNSWQSPTGRPLLSGCFGTAHSTMKLDKERPRQVGVRLQFALLNPSACRAAVNCDFRVSQGAFLLRRIRSQKGNAAAPPEFRFHPPISQLCRRASMTSVWSNGKRAQRSPSASGLRMRREFCRAQ
jgi:hypothetical protein